MTATFETTSLRTLRKDKLTNNERLEALWARQKPDRVPIYPTALGFASLNAGYTIKDLYTDPKKSVDSLRWTCEQYGWHPFLTFFGAATAFPAEEFGGEVKYPEGEFAMAPTTSRHPIESDDDILNLKVPKNLENLGTIPQMLEGTAYMMKFDGLIAMPLAVGPMDAAGPLMGVEKACKYMFKKPELIHKLFRVVTDFRVDLLKLWADKFGTERLVPLVGGPTHSNQIISPKQFEEFCLPYVKEQHDKMREMGYKHTFFHPCGEQNANMPFWAQCDMGDPGIISIGHEVELETAAKYFPNDIIFGNLEPAKVQVETPEKVYNATRDLILKGKEIPGGYFFGCGCELPPKPPIYNVWMMTKAINDYGWYD